MAITYALVAEGSIKSTTERNYQVSVVAETSRQKTLRRVIEEKVIPRMMDKQAISSYDKLLLTHEMFTFFIKRERSSLGDVFHVVISTHEGKQRICWKMIDSMSHEYHTDKKKMNLTKLLEFHNNPENDKITKLQNAIEETKNVMIVNIDKILDNHKKMHEIIVETDSLKEQGELFEKGSKKLKWAMVKRWIYLTGAAIATGAISIGTIALILVIAL
ncbi:predicted protein [Naegleria gruberi]|uniref:Predicted protein n=1 Tax=Naegleria gruberi TaxID=5762 RepID=D2VJH2_NAEGR|nr:uncharacterized protein NAEGRDRAFT_69037 [Naegleria gruberi]EFC42944.1 predicted protein [Naegleria gruberi]|eukprot:XP_002675688.1 predicted protein [Naegleria gruberi strain NEG-M]